MGLSPHVHRHRELQPSKWQVSPWFPSTPKRWVAPFAFVYTNPEACLVRAAPVYRPENGCVARLELAPARRPKLFGPEPRPSHGKISDSGGPPQTFFWLWLESKELGLPQVLALGSICQGALVVPFVGATKESQMEVEPTKGPQK